jgi:hypothetical protein
VHARAGLVPRAQLIGIGLVAVIALIAAISATIFQLGSDSAVADINETNREAQDEADQASSVFERCIDGGGLFDFATGECRGR